MFTSLSSVARCVLAGANPTLGDVADFKNFSAVTFHAFLEGLAFNETDDDWDRKRRGTIDGE